MEHATGIDVSAYQGKMDWDKAKSKGIRFAACRATIGDYYVDPYFPRNWSEMQRVGLWRTAYHVVRPNVNAVAQMNNFFNTVGSDDPDIPWVLDCEVHFEKRKIMGVLKTTKTYTPQEINSRTLQCANIIEQRTGRKPLIYTNKNHVDNYMHAPSFLANYELWVASYPNDYSQPLQKPKMPSVWNEWLIWQFEADGNGKGAEYGAQSLAIDIDRFNGTADEMQAYFKIQGGQQPGPLPPATVATWPDDGLPRYHETIFHQFDWITFPDSKYGRLVKVKPTSSDTSYVTVSYRPQLPSAGRYLVEAFIPSINANARQATYIVEHYVNGTSTGQQITIDQSAFHNQWVPLGEFELDPAREDDGRVDATDFSLEQPPQLIAFSGIRWRKLA